MRDWDKFTDSWRRWVEVQFPAAVMMHLPPPPNVPPVWPAAPVVVVAKGVLKAATTPAPQKGAYRTAVTYHPSHGCALRGLPGHGVARGG